MRKHLATLNKIPPRIVLAEPRRITVLLVALLAAIPALARSHALPKSAASVDPDLRSAAVVVMDAGSEKVLYSRRADVAAPIASITKLMTALVVLEAHQSLDETITISEEDHRATLGNVSHLAVGTQLSRGDVMHLALMSSENRAAHALGRTYPGGVPALVQAMNAKARALGMSRTHFVEPTGLSSQNVASPLDLTRLVRATAQNQTVREFSTDSKYAVISGGRRFNFVNTNQLVSNPTWRISLQKTGYISEGGKCLVMKTVIRDREVVIVLLDSYGKYTRIADARRVRKWMESSDRWRSSLSAG
jgi:serine-type D-Ala-D-Ala endopeptidase (penicillin-binding protein 7)